MSKHNYNNYSKRNDNETAVTSPVEESPVGMRSETPVVDEVVSADVTDNPTPQHKVVEDNNKVEEPKQVVGVVTGCAKLRVRKNPNPNAAVLCEVNASTEVMIDEKASTGEFYKVCTEAGIEGFCMKKFITVM